ncbi:hypothetical protein AB6E50_22625 [Vibrio cyclitrophicus]
MPQGRYSAHNTIGSVLEDAENGLDILARELLQDLSNKPLWLDFSAEIQRARY